MSARKDAGHRHSVADLGKMGLGAAALGTGAYYAGRSIYRRLTGRHKQQHHKHHKEHHHKSIRTERGGGGVQKWMKRALGGVLGAGALGAGAMAFGALNLEDSLFGRSERRDDSAMPSLADIEASMDSQHTNFAPDESEYADRERSRLAAREVADYARQNRDNTLGLNEFVAGGGEMDDMDRQYLADLAADRRAQGPSDFDG